VAVVNGYVSVADVREHLDDEDVQVIDEALIERAINAASRAIDDYCGFPKRRFWKDSAPTVHEYVVEDTGLIYVDDIASTASLVIETGETFSDVWTTTEYQLLPLNAASRGPAYAWTKIRATGARFFPTHRLGKTTVRVTGIHGWSEVPVQVQEACLLKATALLKRKDAVFGVAGFGEFGTAVRIRADDPDVVALLSNLVRYGAGTTG